MSTNDDHEIELPSIHARGGLALTPEMTARAEQHGRQRSSLKIREAD